MERSAVGEFARPGARGCKRVAPPIPRNTARSRSFCIEDASGKRWLTIRHSAMREAGLEKHKGVIAKQTILIVRDTTAQKQAEQEREASRNLFALRGSGNRISP